MAKVCQSPDPKKNSRNRSEPAPGRPGLSVAAPTMRCMGILTVVDETTSGGRGQAWELVVAEERLPLREVIARRVCEEVARYNAQAGEVFQGLVQPTDTERLLNGYRMRERRVIDPQAQCRLALRAFERNGFLVLVGDRQVEDLDTVIESGTGVEVSFLKLVPLVGG